MDSLHRSPLPPACHQQSQRVTECYTSLVHARGLTCETLKSSRRPALVAAENWIGNSQNPFSSLKTPRKAMRKEVSLAGLQCFPSLSIFTGPRKIRHLGPGPAGTLQPSGSSLPPGLLVLQPHRIDTDEGKMLYRHLIQKLQHSDPKQATVNTEAVRVTISEGPLGGQRSSSYSLTFPIIMTAKGFSSNLKGILPFKLFFSLKGNILDRIYHRSNVS